MVISRSSGGSVKYISHWNYFSYFFFLHWIMQRVTAITILIDCSKSIIGINIIFLRRSTCSVYHQRNGAGVTSLNRIGGASFNYLSVRITRSHVWTWACACFTFVLIALTLSTTNNKVFITVILFLNFSLLNHSVCNYTIFPVRSNIFSKNKKQNGRYWNFLSTNQNLKLSPLPNYLTVNTDLVQWKSYHRLCYHNRITLYCSPLVVLSLPLLKGYKDMIHFALSLPLPLALSQLYGEFWCPLVVDSLV